MYRLQCGDLMYGNNMYIRLASLAQSFILYSTQSIGFIDVIQTVLKLIQLAMIAEVHS